MNRYAVIGGSIWGNRGAEAMAVTTIGRVRDHDPEASFLIMSYFPGQDRELVNDATIRVIDATPTHTVIQFAFALLCRVARLLHLRVPDAALPNSVRLLRQCRALFDVSGVSFHDGRLAVVAYNLMCVLPALLLGVPVIRLSQAMGPFRHPLNRLPARWVTKRSLQTFARGRHTADYLRGLGVPEESWSVAADVAFSYRAEHSLSDESSAEVAAMSKHLTAVRTTGTDVVALVPSSLVHQKMADEGGDYVQVLQDLIVALQHNGLHVLVLPNATRAGEVASRNNDLVVVEELRIKNNASGGRVETDGISYVEFDLNTASIRSLVEPCALLITSRFHAMVAGLALGVPTLVMGWSHKYEEVLEMFECADHAVDFSEAEHKLISMAISILTERDQIRNRILERLPAVVASSMAQFELVDSQLKEKHERRS